MAAFSSRLLFHPLLTVHGSLTFIGDATVALLSGRWLSFNWGQLINSRLDGQASVYKTVRGGDDDSLLSSYCSPSVSISSSRRHPVFLQRYTRQRHAPLISPLGPRSRSTRKRHLENDPIAPHFCSTIYAIKPCLAAPRRDLFSSLKRRKALLLR